MPHSVHSCPSLQETKGGKASVKVSSVLYTFRLRIELKMYAPSASVLCLSESATSCVGLCVSTLASSRK